MGMSASKRKQRAQARHCGSGKAVCFSETRDQAVISAPMCGLSTGIADDGLIDTRAHKKVFLAPGQWLRLPRLH